jgi:RNA polymerase sigma-70 factor (ECF subfamily)
MPDGQLATVVRRLHTLAQPERTSDLTDEQLLERFAAQRDEEAFALLVRRHGPMVLGVCRRVLRNEADAEDAFQAAFLILARRAGSVRHCGALAGWLYRVALRAALSLRGRAGQGEARARPAPARGGEDPAVEAAWRELRPVLDEEVGRLPEKYRVAVVLCHLEGKTHEAAAAELGWPRGTVAGRLARARDLLRRRLSRRGVTLSTVALAALLAGKASAAVPEGLAGRTAETATRFAAGEVSLKAAALAQGVLHAMFLTKIKIAAVVTMLFALSAGAGLFALAGAAAESPGVRNPAAQAAAFVPPGGVVPAPAAEVAAQAPDKGKPPPPVKFEKLKAPAEQPPEADGDEEAIQGAWRLVDAERNGKEAGEDPYRRQSRWLIGKDVIALRDRNGSRGSWGYKLDPTKDPKTIDLLVASGPGKTTMIPAIYQLSGDRLKICLAGPDNVRPKEINTRPKTGWTMYTLKREPPLQAAKPVEKGKPSEYSSLSVMTPKGWNLRINPDGSGSYGYGSGFADTVALPAGTFDFADIAEELKKRTQPKGTTRTAYTVALHRPGVRVTVAVYTTDAEYVAGLFAAARARETRSPGGRIQRVWSQSPPTPLNAATWRQRPVEIRPPGPPFVARLSADGKLAATGARPRLWDASTGKELAVLIPLKVVVLPPGVPPPLQHVPVRAVAFSPDGTVLATGGADGTVKLWDVEKRAERATLKPPAAPGPTFPVLSLAFHPDGKVLAVAVGRVVRLWDLEGGKELVVCSGHTGPIGCVAFNPEGSALATASADNTVRLWDPATGKEQQRFERHNDWVRTVAFSPDGKLLATAGKDRAVHVWNLERNEVVCTLRGHTGEVRAAVFTPDGKALLTGGDDRAIRVWDLAREEQQDVLGHPSEVRSLSLSADGALLAVAGADAVVKLWEPSQPPQDKQ